MTMQAIVIDVDVESYIRKPAVTNRSDLYLIDRKKVVGKVRRFSATYRGNGLYDRVAVEPDDDATREYFKNDPRWIGGVLLGVYFDGVLGCRWLSLEDGNDPLYPDAQIVDCFEFDFGICHERFHDVEGFDSYHTEQNRLRIHTKHKARRPRKTHKVKHSLRILQQIG